MVSRIIKWLMMVKKVLFSFAFFQSSLFDKFLLLNIIIWKIIVILNMKTENWFLWLLSIQWFHENLESILILKAKLRFFKWMIFYEFYSNLRKNIINSYFNEKFSYFRQSINKNLIWLYNVQNTLYKLLLFLNA
jgi:hypothetical protein